MQQDKCKICRRVGQKLFLKGDRCFSTKCAMIKRAFPPGPEKKKRRGGAPSEYKRALTEKQKLRNWYGLPEYQFKNYVKGVLAKRSKIQDIADELIKRLEKRLDSIVFRSGFAKSRVHARQLVNHGFFSVNNKGVDIPSYEVKKGDVIAVKENKRKKPVIISLLEEIKKREVSLWLEVNKETLVSKLKADPTLAEVVPPAEISIIFEYYSR